MLAQRIALNIPLKLNQIETVLQLLSEGSTIPFIARYRKDATGALDEVQIEKIKQESSRLQEFDARKASIEKSIIEQGKMTEELQEKINAAVSLSQLEDIYLPYKQKRKTRAMIAREHGLQPLAEKLLAEENFDIELETAKYFNEKLETSEAVMQGARDIVAEHLNEDLSVREKIRKLFEKEATIQSNLITDKEKEAQKFTDYFDFKESIKTIPSHRVLAILRGFLEGYLRISIEPEEEKALMILEEMYISKVSDSAEHLKKAIRDGYRRLLQPGLETEFRTQLKMAADEEAIHVFSENLRQLLLSAPLGSRKILAIDPGYRTGCKLVCLDEKGELLQTGLIYVHEKNNRIIEAEQKVREVVNKYQIEAVAIGDGTAGRETEQFIKSLNLDIPVFLVNEDGASIYSASEIARQEFPNEDITVRGAISIGRRLMDPLAELVKIDPKSIGVGQYQHDVNQPRLKERLDQTVMSCVNSVGINLNTASKHLLSYVSGIGDSLAENLISYRRTNGKFNSRKELLKVPRLGEKAYEQAAGFLRIPDAKNVLDRSAVHPEAYTLVEKMAADHDTAIESMIGNESMLKNIDPDKYADAQFGVHTIKDILKELQKPGLDPRSSAQVFEFAKIYSIEDCVVGMEVPGMVTNITRFGAFVDIGVKQDGLVHVSEIANRYISDPAEVLKLNQPVKVKILEVDIPRKRIGLSIKQTEKSDIPNRKAIKKQMPVKKESPSNNLQDALSALKMKFGK